MPAWRDWSACRLEDVTIYHCFGITDGGFQHLGKISTLRQLIVRGVPLTGQRFGIASRPAQTGGAAIE